MLSAGRHRDDALSQVKVTAGCREEAASGAESALGRAPLPPGLCPLRGRVSPGPIPWTGLPTQWSYLFYSMALIYKLPVRTQENPPRRRWLLPHILVVKYCV